MIGLIFCSLLGSIQKRKINFQGLFLLNGDQNQYLIEPLLPRSMDCLSNCAGRLMREDGS